ncbi:hypothetical protein Tco_1306785 [Tanacetum coccineum]
MNPQEKQIVAGDDKCVPFSKRVKISSTNIRLETTVPQKEETFQVVIDLIKNSTCFKVFTISADVLEIFMQQFWYSIKKVQGTDSYEFLLANKKCTINAEVFRIILDICPRVEGVDFIDVPDDDTALTFLIDLGYKGLLYKHTNMFVDHMHHPWRTLATIINKCLSGKTTKEQEAADIMQALKESKRTSKIQAGTGGLNEGTGSKPGVPNESTFVSTTLSEGTSIKPGVPDEEKGITKEKVILEWGDEQDNEHSNDDNDDVEKDDRDGDADDEGNDHINDTQDTNDEDVKIEFGEEDIYKYKIHVRKDEDEEMINAEVDDSEKSDEEITDATKADAKKISEAKDDAKKTELPPSSSSLYVSLGFSYQFLKLSSNSSLVSDCANMGTIRLR